VSEPEPEFREPEGIVETFAANIRPQPAIPAVFVLLMTIMLPLMSHDPAASDGSWLLWLIPVGLAASCGLAIAAGFCSLFPHIVWVLIATWALRFTASGALPGYNRYVLFAGMIVVAVMFCVQVWRVRTRRFVPTVRVARDQ
jgi:hypothetical protein